MSTMQTNNKIICLTGEEQYRLLFENAQEGIFRSTPEGRIILANPAFIKMLGYNSAEEVFTLNIERDIYQHEKELKKILYEAGKSGKFENVEITWLKKDGSTLYVRLNGRVILDNNDNVAYYENTVVDITAYKVTEKKLKASQQLFHDIISCLPDPTFAIDKQGHVIAWNKAMEALTDVPATEIMGKDYTAYSKALYGRKKELLINMVLRANNDYINNDYTNIQYEGDSLIAESFSPILRKNKGAYLWSAASVLRDSEGTAIGAIKTIKDFTEYKQSQEELQFLSRHDILTRLYSRMYFEKQVEALSQCTQQKSVIMLDIDGLKLINDTMGHHKGDKLLISAARLIKSVFRSTDIIARIGGDEFAIIMMNTDNQTAEKACNRLRIATDEYNKCHKELPLNLSIGITSGNIPIHKLLIEADNNLNRDKLIRSSGTKSRIINTLKAMLEERDYITSGHAFRIEKMVDMMADDLDLTLSQRSDLKLLARLHDIGKVAISDTILFKPSKLSEDEMAEMKRHSEIGFRIAQSTQDLEHIAQFILHHHEWWNGRGYPLGLEKENIPFLSRIISLLDSFDAMTSDRPYRKALSCSEAIAEIRKYRGIQFDPKIVDAFIKMITKYKCFTSTK